MQIINNSKFTEKNINEVISYLNMYNYIDFERYEYQIFDFRELISEKYQLKENKNINFQIQLHIRCFFNSYFNFLENYDFYNHNQNIEIEDDKIRFFYNKVCENLLNDTIIEGHKNNCVCFFGFYDKNKESKEDKYIYYEELSTLKTCENKESKKNKLLNRLFVSVLYDFDFVQKILRDDHFDTYVCELTSEYKKFIASRQSLSINKIESFLKNANLHLIKIENFLRNEAYKDFNKYVLLMEERLKKTYLIHLLEILSFFRQELKTKLNFFNKN